MRSFPRCIDSKIEIFFTFPFRLEVEMVPWSAQKRQKVLPEVAKKLVSEVNEQLTFLQVHFSETVDLMTAESQTRVNWILFVLNILTFSTVIATLITTYDIADKVLRPDFRLLLIGAGTTLFALLTLVFLTKNRIVILCKRKG